MLHINKGYAPTSKHHHDTIAQARDCEAQVAREDAEAHAEIEAELAIERYLENVAWPEFELQRQMDELNAPFDLWR